LVGSTEDAGSGPISIQNDSGLSRSRIILALADEVIE
jgi:hypothetical protein